MVTSAGVIVRLLAHVVPARINRDGRSPTKPWIETLTRLAASFSDNVFVPGHGDVGHAPDVLAFRDYLVALRQLIGSAHADGKSGRAVEDAVLPKLTAQYGQWDYFKDVAPSNISQTDAELRGTKRIPQSRTP
jgi:hypothetical protein